MEWKQLPNGILQKNAPIKTCLNDAYEEDIKGLGYNRHELYPQTNYGTDPIIIGYFQLFSDELVAIRTNGDHIMSQFEIESFLAELFDFSEDEEERCITEGIEDGDISQEFVEEVCKQKAENGTINNGKYLLEFKDGRLTGFSSADGYSATARQFLDIDAYEIEASSWYDYDMTKVAKEINLHAECMANMDFDFLKSYSARSKFSYPSGQTNFIAMAAHFKTSEVAFQDVLNSTHGDYQEISHNGQIMKIRAYGETFAGFVES